MWRNKRNWEKSKILVKTSIYAWTQRTLRTNVIKKKKVQIKEYTTKFLKIEEDMNKLKKDIEHIKTILKKTKEQID